LENEKTKLEPIKEKNNKISIKTLRIIAVIIILTIFALCLFPESAQSLLDLIKMFLSLFSIAVSGALSAFLK